MPIEGKFYTPAELQTLLGVTKQRISNIAATHNWWAVIPGLYAAEDVEQYLAHYRNISPDGLAVLFYHNPDGETPAELRAEHEAVYQQNEAELDDDE